LLDFSRGELEHFACQSDLSWIIDESNLDERFDRNFVRRQVLPVLGERWPDFGRRWQLTAEACQEADQLNRDLAELDLLALDEKPARGGSSLDWKSLAKLPAYRRNNALRGWASARGFPVMERRHLDQIERQFFASEAASGAMVEWSGTALGYFRGRVYMISSPAQPPEQPQNLFWTVSSDDLQLPDGSILQAIPSAEGLRLSGAQLEVAWRQGGERCRPKGRAHSQTVKKLLQEYELEPWWRSRIPLIYLEGKLAAVGDLWICEEFAAEGDASVALRWLPGGNGKGA
jgi:tRNA(Ile)-lysidine synthase